MPQRGKPFPQYMGERPPVGIPAPDDLLIWRDDSGNTTASESNAAMEARLGGSATALVYVIDPAYGNGTDATAHIEARIAEAEAAGGGVVLFPAGNFRMDPIVVPEAVSIRGSGAGRFQSGAAKGTVLRPLPGATTGTLVTMDGDYTTISDLAIDGAGVIEDGLRLNGARSFASRLIVQSTTRDGIVLDALATYGMKVDAVWVLDCGRYGLFNLYGTDAQFSNIWVGRCTTAQARFEGSNVSVSNIHCWNDDFTSTAIQMRGSHYRMANVFVESCGIGLDFFNSSFNSLANVNAWANTSRGINLIGTSQHNSITGGTLYNNGNGGTLIGETASYNLLAGLHYYDDAFSTQAYAVTVNVDTCVGNRIIDCFALDADTTGGTAIIDNGTGTIIRVGDEERDTPAVFRLPQTLAGQLVLTDSPNTKRFAGNSMVSRLTIANLADYKQVRFTGVVTTTSASANTPKIVLQYATTYTGTVGNYNDIGTSEVSFLLSGSTGIRDTGWIDLAAGAKIDPCYFAMMEQGGDSTADPAITAVYVEFR